MCRVRVLLLFVHFQLRASQGTVLAPPAGTTISGSYIAPCTNALLGSVPPAYGLKFFVNVGSPDPAITRHLWAEAAKVSARPVAAGAAELTVSTASDMTPVAATASERMRRKRIVVLSHPVGG